MQRGLAGRVSDMFLATGAGYVIAHVNDIREPMTFPMKAQ